MRSVTSGSTGSAVDARAIRRFLITSLNSTPEAYDPWSTSNAARGSRVPIGWRDGLEPLPLRASRAYHLCSRRGGAAGLPARLGPGGRALALLAVRDVRHRRA